MDCCSPPCCHNPPLPDCRVCQTAVRRPDIKAGWDARKERGCDASIQTNDAPAPSPGLGDAVAKALSFVGITDDRVKSWLGNCGCKERREKLNRLGSWAAKAIMGPVEQAKKYFDEMMK